MRTGLRHSLPHVSARGFSLIEMSIVVAILAIVSVMGLEGAANFVNRTNGQVTREKLVVLDDAMVRFFRIYGRLPCPADRTLAPSDTSYGTEKCSLTAITGSSSPAGSNIGGGILAGAIPFRALNLPMIASIDGFSAKFNYVVTKNMTVAGGTVAASPVTGRFGSHDSDTATACTTSACGMAGIDVSQLGMGGIEIRSGLLEQPCGTGGSPKCQVGANPTHATTNVNPNGAVYVIFSSGADRKGAVSPRGTELADCVSSSSTSDGFKIDAQNCAYLNDGLPYTTGGTAPRQNTAVGSTIPVNVFYDVRINTGLLSKNYFDDYVIWRTRGRL